MPDLPRATPEMATSFVRGVTAVHPIEPLRHATGSRSGGVIAARNPTYFQLEMV
jgi:hypothetical protein